MEGKLVKRPVINPSQVTSNVISEFKSAMRQVTIFTHFTNSSDHKSFKS